MEVTENQYKIGRFDIAEDQMIWWWEVRNGNLENAEELKSLIAHEYIESRLMQSGLPYNSNAVSTSARFGAHDLSIKDDHTNFNFNHWNFTLKRNVPAFNLENGFNNIDNIVNEIKLIEGF